MKTTFFRIMSNIFKEGWKLYASIALIVTVSIYLYESGLNDSLSNVVIDVVMRTVVTFGVVLLIVTAIEYFRLKYKETA